MSCAVSEDIWACWPSIRRGQGRGLGRRLVEAAEDHLREAGCEAVEIIVLNMRPELVPIYRRFGFAEEGTTAFKPSRTLKPGVECYGIIIVKKLVPSQV